MKTRCYNSNSTAYKWYGGRGIVVCDEWRGDFAAFEAWALENGYADSLSLDRIDSELDYAPDNCQWIPRGDNAQKAQAQRWNFSKEEIAKRAGLWEGYAAECIGNPRRQNSAKRYQETAQQWRRLLSYVEQEESKRLLKAIEARAGFPLELGEDLPQIRAAKERERGQG